VRLARGLTGRDKIVKFDGCYTALRRALGGGWERRRSDGTARFGRRHEGAVGDTIVAPYNEVPSWNHHVAAVLVEPVAANMNLVAPERGFLRGLRANASRVGALLIFDEVITGFRLAFAAPKSIWRDPDVWCFARSSAGAAGGRV